MVEQKPNCYYPVVEEVCKQILKSVFFTDFIVKTKSDAQIMSALKGRLRFILIDRYTKCEGLGWW